MTLRKIGPEPAVGPGLGVSHFTYLCMKAIVDSNSCRMMNVIEANLQLITYTPHRMDFDHACTHYVR